MERATNECEVICRGMFKKETNLSLFAGLNVTLSSGEVGTIDSSFGQSGKFKVRVPGEKRWAAFAFICGEYLLRILEVELITGGLKTETLEMIGAKKRKDQGHHQEPVRIGLAFKKYIYSKKIAQWYVWCWERELAYGFILLGAFGCNKAHIAHSSYVLRNILLPRCFATWRFIDTVNERLLEKVHFVQWSMS